MAEWSDVRRAALALPAAEEAATRSGLLRWQVKGRDFVWERPLRRADLDALADAAPTGDVIGAHVVDLGARSALLHDAPDVFFTTPHFDGYPVVLARLAELDMPTLEEVVVEAWLCRAPVRMARAYLAEQRER